MHTTHGGSKTRLYRIWQGMIQRCYNPNCHQFKWYGGRGVRVCEAWRNFPNFRDWALSAGYADSLTIDRVRGDVGYDPGNCRWMTRIENTRRAQTVIVNAFGESKPFSKWMQDERCKATYNAFFKRVGRGWSVERAMATPIGGPGSGMAGRPRKKITAWGKCMTAAEWLADPRCKAETETAIRGRISAGWDAERALTTQRRIYQFNR
jgi:hypothetical protein